MNEAMARLRRQQQSGSGGDSGYILEAIVGTAAGKDGQRIDELPIDKLHPFAKHTFKLRSDNDEYIKSMKDSIEKNGVLEPLIVRPLHGTTDYEIIAGHTRHHLAMEAGITVLPCIIKDLDDNQAVVEMGETNLQRPEWLPSEKAKTYKAHLLAIQAIREKKDNQLVGKSRDIAAARWGITGKMLDTYVRISSLSNELLDMVDAGRVAIKAAYKITYMSTEAQLVVLSLLQQHSKLKLTEKDVDTLMNEKCANYEKMLGLCGDEAPVRSQSTWKFEILRSAVPDAAKAHLNDPVLNDRIIKTINDYLAELAEKGD